MRTPNFDFVGRSRLWAMISGALVLVSLGSLLIGGLDLSIDFVGGTAYRLEGIDPETTSDDLRAAAEDAGARDVLPQLQGEGDTRGALVRTDAMEPGSDEALAVERALVEVSDADNATISFVGPNWGQRITQQALEALLVFMVVVVIYISFRLEFKMAVAAVVALVHDLLITIGLYALVGFNVSPATVIALLTILGYSLYDTVVVFDRVKENAVQLGEPGRRTYAQLINASMNEVLYRSLNTSITSVLPVAALLFIGAQVLGATTLQDLALALFLGMAVGVYSSLFVASPFLAWWKMREPEQRKAAERETERLARGDEPDAEVAAPTASASRRAPITTEYVRGEGKRKKRRR
ncbi:protein translocase subunit SecF [Egicoccus sp. AB-alg6-2]|uniref:protein translocase subunit SecF n=1 Tax=Egicoccus sp. AB-alg6-2 TaxID=3242692 RepID=UPI00359D1877